MRFHALLICLHVLAAAFWVGGMATVHFAARPAAVRTLTEPALRLPFMAALLERFFAGVALAIGVLIATGGVLIVRAGGFAALHASVHVMVGAGLLMAGLFVRIRLGPYRRLQRGIAARDWRAAGAELAAIRALVVINLVIGTGVFAVALMGRVL